MIRRVLKKAAKLWQVLRFATKAARPGPLAWIRSVARTARICRLGHYRPREAFRFGLLDPDLEHPEQAPFISRNRMSRLQKALNPEPLTHLLRDKIIFHRYCQALDIPQAELLAVVYPRTVGWACDGAPLASRGDWERFLAGRLGDTFVAKPITESHGNGVNILTRDGDRFVDAFGAGYDAAGLYDWLLGIARPDGAMLQQRLRNHPSLAGLSGADCLETLRIITLLDGPQSGRILQCHLKLGLPGRVVDNQPVNVLRSSPHAPVDLETGRLSGVVWFSGTAKGRVSSPTHPHTGRLIAGVQLPFWPQTCELIRRTAPAFWPLRAIGWDVAVTADGPRMLEGNFWWEAPNHHPSIRATLAELARAAGVSMVMPRLDGESPPPCPAPPPST